METQNAYSSPAPRSLILRIAFILAVGMLGAGCADMVPQRGETVALQVTRLMSEDWFRHGRKIDIANALAHGLGESEIEAGRLAVVACAIPENEPNPETRWVIRLPENAVLRAGDFVSFKPGTRYGNSGAPGSLEGIVPPPGPAALYTWKYGRTIRCETRAQPGMMQARFAFSFGSNDLREYRLHRDRMRNVDLSEVRAGRIALATCSRMTDGWSEWTVRIPPSIPIGAGDHIIALAGAPDDEPGNGISTALRKIASPLTNQTYAVQGSRIIRCNASNEIR